MLMLKDPKEKNPTERPGWPYPLNAPFPSKKEEKMRLSIRVVSETEKFALIEAVTFTQEHADIAEVLRRLRDFLTGREIKSVSITIEEKTRHD
jgi:hypothetical protein